MDTNKNESNEETEIFDTMEKFGKYQKVQFVYTCLATLFISVTHINYVFVAGDLKYRCRIPECDDKHPIINPSWWPNTTIDRCRRPIYKQYVGESCTSDNFTGTFEECTEWVYESDYTVIADLNLACQPWKSNLIGTIHSIGMLLSMIASGWMTDRFGRKPTLIFCSVGSFVGHLKAFASTYYFYVSVELLEAMLTGGTYTAVMVLMIEIGGKKNRLLTGILFTCFIDLGESVFSIIAMFVPYWKNLVRIIYSPSFIFLSYIFLLKESPRWQIVNGKTEDAKGTLLNISEINKVNINKQKLANMNAESLKNEFKIENYVHRETLKDVLKSKEIVKRILIGAFSRFSASFVYYSLMINSVYLPGDKYTNFILSSFMSYPGDLIALCVMNKVGRKMPLVYGYVICGLLCVVSIFLPEDNTWLNITFFLMSKLVVAGCFSGAVTYTMELFPTSVRGIMLGFCLLASSIGNILAPLTPILNTVSVSLPPLFFGGLAILSGLLLTQTPETINSPLIDTIQQVEQETRRKQNNIVGHDNAGFHNNGVI